MFSIGRPGCAGGGEGGRGWLDGETQCQSHLFVCVLNARDTLITWNCVGGNCHVLLHYVIMVMGKTNENNFHMIIHHVRYLMIPRFCYFPLLS